MTRSSPDTWFFRGTMGSRLSSREILEKLVAFPTVSSESNLALIDWVEDYLGAHGVGATRVPNDAGTHASLYANVGPEVEGGVILSGHTDVVPVEGQNWSTDPFQVFEKSGRLYGRGTADMKGFDALALWAVPLALERGMKRPIQIALSYDEEVGCTGAPPMIDHIAAKLPRASAVIVGEPSLMKVVSGHKAASGWSIHMRGHEVHSSRMHEGVSAVMEGARLIDWANRMNEGIRAKSPTPLAAAFDPPFTTVHVGIVEGGTAHNITAKDCRFAVDFRVVADERIDDWHRALFEEIARIDAGMNAVHPDAGIEVSEMFEIPGLAPESEGVAEGLARRLTGDNSNHTVSYGTEAGQFQERGYSAVICGPGDIAQAHQPNEFIEIAQLTEGEHFLEQLIETMCD